MAGAAGRTIVVAVDENDHSKVAFDWFLSNVYRADDTVVICHVPEAPSLPTFSFKSGIAPPVEEWQKAMTSQLDRIRKLEEDFEAELIRRKVQYKMRVEQCKKPGQGIVAVAQEVSANMIIMGTRGLDALKRAFIGSVSEYVVRHSAVPVLVCPMPRA